MGTSVDNPIDLGMGSDRFHEWYTQSIQVLSADEGVDMFFIIGGIQGPGFAEKLLEAVGVTSKPAAFASGDSRGSGTDLFLPKKGLALYPDGKRAARALGKLMEYVRRKKPV